MTQRTFTNPVLPGFYPDPSVCRVGEDYYLVTSSFEYFPGVPIFHSRDLVHWRQLGHVLTRPSQLPLAGVPSSAGIYAPTLRHARGRFYLVTTNVGGGGNFFVTAEHPEGPWSEPVFLGTEGIDPSFAFLGDDVIYTGAGPGPDFDHPLIYGGRVDLERGAPVAPLEPIFAGTGGVWSEAPHLYQRGAHIYLVIAEGGTGYDHSVVVARAPAPAGPFVAYEGNPVLTHRDAPEHPIQATGHTDLVDLPDGSTWAVLLGVRPIVPGHHLLGRETFLAPVTWSADGWPHLGVAGRIELEMAAPALPPHPWPALPPRDDFDAVELRPAYVFLRNPDPACWSLSERPGCLRLRGNAATLDDVASPALVLHRQQHFAFECRTALDFAPATAGDLAGLILRGDERCHYDLVVGATDAGRVVRLSARIAGERQLVVERALPAGPVVLGIAGSRDEYRFFVETAGARSELGALPTLPLTAERITGGGQMCFTGVMLGLYATGSGAASQVPADFDWFELAPR